MRLRTKAAIWFRLGEQQRVLTALIERTTETVEILGRKYGLTREQQSQIRMVLRARDRHMLAEYRKHARSLPEPQRSEIMSARRHADERIYAVLNKDQREQYLEDLRIEPHK